MIEKVHDIVGKQITKTQLLALEKSARSEGFITLAQNLRKLANEDPATNQFVINHVSDSNFIDQETLCGFEHDHLNFDSLNGKNSDSIYEEITNLIIKTIEENKNQLIWEKPWAASRVYRQLMNFVSKKRYRGINLLLLELIYPLKHKKEWVNPYFMTEAQVLKKGGSLKGSPKGYPIIFYTIGYSYYDKAAGIDIRTYKKADFIKQITPHKHKIDALKSGELSLSDFADQNTFSIIREYDVFNGEDIEGIDWKLEEVPTKDDFEPIEAAEAIVEHMQKRPDIKHGGNRAYYSPTHDFVNMPPKSTFKKDQFYYATQFHELIHSTGHPTRLKRNLTGEFGSEKYAFEELIAEIGAAYLTAESGILNHHIKNTGAYIISWNKRLIKKLKDDKTFIFRAAAKAQKAADFILQPDKAGIPKYLRSKGAIKTPKAPEKKEKTERPVAKKVNKPSIKTPIPVAKKKKSQKDPDQMSLFGDGKKKKGLSGPPELASLFVTPGEPIKMINPFRLTGEFGKLLGELQRYRLVILLTGDTHSGKTQFAWQLVDSFVDSNYKVGIFDLEQGGMQSKDTQATSDRNVKPANQKKLHVTGEAPNGIDTIRACANMFDVIMIDSWQKLKLPNTKMDDLRQEFPNTIFIIIFQQNGDGGTRGGVSADFDVPLAIKVHKVDGPKPFVNNYAEVWKNRGNAVGIKYNWFKKKIVADKPAAKPKKK